MALHRVPLPAVRRCLVCLVSAWLVTGQSRADDQTSELPIAPEETVEPDPEASGEAAYSVRLEGVDDGAIKALMERSSQLVSLAHRPPITEAGLWRRIEDDRGRFDRIFRSEGYYAARTEANIDASTTPPTVVIQADLGPRFTFRSFAIEQAIRPPEDGGIVEAAMPAEPPEKMPELPSLTALGITIGAPARAADVLAAEKQLIEYCANHGHPLARTFDRKAIVDHANQTMEVTVMLDPGPQLAFGPVTVSGHDRVEEDFVRRLIPWTEGEPYDQRKIQQFRQRLVGLGLFSSLVITPATTPDADSRLPIAIDLIEGKMQSIGFGAKYYTSEGPAVEFFWEHRNAFGRGENVTVTTEVGMMLQSVALDVLFPHYNRVDQDLIASAEAKRETTDAYDRTGIEAGVRLRRKFDNIWTVSSGPSLETAWIKENGESTTTNSTLLGLPSYIYRDTTNSPLNPTQGTRLRYGPTPYVGWYNQRITFLSNELSGSGYLSLDPSSRYVLAGRAKVGMIAGASNGDIPADKRFYAGGGSSIRGYPYQKVGPLDSDHDPIGGRSLLELSAEFRARVWGNFGIVPFIDGGTVYNSVYPDGSETIRWGAGIGFRYYTVIGPVRLDFAFPINPPDAVDDPFQFYVNIGQAF